MKCWSLLVGIEKEAVLLTTQRFPTGKLMDILIVFCLAQAMREDISLLLSIFRKELDNFCTNKQTIVTSERNECAVTIEQDGSSVKKEDNESRLLQVCK